MTSSPRLRLVKESDAVRGPAVPSGDAQDAMLEAFDSDAALGTRFESACREGAAALREEVLTFRIVLKERGHLYRRHDREHEETAEALYELAGELLPDSPAAALARLRERVAGRQEMRTAQEAVEELAASEPEWFDELALLSSRPPKQERLRAVAQRLWDELRIRGQRHEARGFSDCVWHVLRDFFPESPGAAWDRGWADGIYSETLGDLAHHARLAGVDYADVDLSGFERTLEEMQTLDEARDRSAFREAARRAVREGRCAVQEAKAYAS